MLLNWQRFCEVVIELYYQEVWLVLDNIYIYMRICLVHNHVTDQGLPIQQMSLFGVCETRIASRGKWSLGGALVHLHHDTSREN